MTRVTRADPPLAYLLAAGCLSIGLSFAGGALAAALFAWVRRLLGGA